MPDYGDSQGFQYQDSGSQGSTGWTSLGGNGSAQDWGGGQGGTSQGLANIQAQAAEAQAIVDAQAAADAQAAMIAFTKKQAALKEKNRIEKLFDNLFTAGTGIFSSKPIEAISPTKKALIMQGLGQYSPIKGFQPGGASTIAGLLKAFLGKDQKYRVDKEGNFILDKEGKKQFTKEGIIDYLRGNTGWFDASVLESMKRDMPSEYYGKVMGMPQTTGELENLAGMDVSGPNVSPTLRQMIFDARAELDRQQGDQGGGGGGGIPDIVLTDPVPEPTPDPVPTPLPTPDPVLTPTPAPIAPINYADIAPQYTSAYPGYPTNYVDQGLPALAFNQWPDVKDWYNNLNTYWGYNYPQGG